MTYGEHPAMKAVEPPDPQAAPDCRVAQSEFDQLRSRHDAVLARREPGDLRVWGD
jgi:hypothetical protein